MEATLAGQPWLAGPRPTLADIACYPYVACAPEGGVPLESYPEVRAWIARFEALPGVKEMPRSAVPA
jgi:glutathione S-transferase